VLARLVAQQIIDTLFGVAHLRAPYRRTADTGLARYLLHRQPFGREHDYVRSLDMLERADAVAEERGNVCAILSADDGADCLGHADRIDVGGSLRILRLRAPAHGRDDPAHDGLSSGVPVRAPSGKFRDMQKVTCLSLHQAAPE
jgi:hypothetical protein